MKYILMAFINHYDWVNSSMLRFLLKTLLIITLGLLPVANTALAQVIDTSGFKRVIREGIGFYGIPLDAPYHDTTHFLRDASFYDAHFDSVAYFSYTHFASEADFREARFDSVAYFVSADFIPRADFSYTHFYSEAIFGDAWFNSIASFYDTHFASEADFSYTKFDSGVIFREANFASKAIFRKARFNSEADFSYTNFDSVAIFREANFASEADFSYTNFDSVAIFREANFASEADFREARFNSVANFYDAHFASEAIFVDARFDSVAIFEGARFDSEAIFGDAWFNSVANFYDARFDSMANFYDAHFASEAIFDDAHFASEANFYDARFDSVAIFDDAHFDSLAYFGDARFDSVAYFQGAEFSSEFILDGCLLPDILFFNGVKTEQEIDFTYTLTDTIPGSKKRCVIDLYKTDISKIKLDYSRFRVLRDTSRYQRRQLSNIYEQVLKMQKEQGFIDGYQVADIEYQQFQLTYDRENPFLASFGITFSWGHFINWLQKYWWDYGYAQEYIFFWIFGALSIFTLINAFLFRTLNEHVYKIKNIYPYRYYPPQGSSYKRSKVPDTSPPVSPAVAGLEMPTGKVLIMSFFYTSLIFFGLKMSVDRINFDRWGYALLLIFEYSFGLICLAYLVNFIIN